MMNLNGLVFVLFVTSGVWSQLQDDEGRHLEDEVFDLPGLSPSPTFRHFSGYLQISDTKYLHYWFTESQRSPKNDPLVLWLNGGPGCSSLSGLLTENGPFRVQSGGQRLDFHEYSWNRIANILFLEAPAGVGFSYATDGNYTTDDDIVAKDNYEALKQFMKKFPYFANHPLYLTGESYAGIYIPTLMMHLKDDKAFKVKGLAIGNGLLDTALLSSTMIPYLYYHGIIDQILWQEITEACCLNQTHQNCRFMPFPNAQCEKKVADAMLQYIKIPINPYNIYTDCDKTQQTIAKSQRVATMVKLTLIRVANSYDNPEALEAFKSTPRQQSRQIPCTDSSSEQIYLNRKDVQEALHIKSDTDLPPWNTCSSLIDFVSPDSIYKTVYNDMKAQFLSILNDKQYHILVYNGDMDIVCNFLGDQLFVNSLNQKEIAPYQPWMYNKKHGSKQLGGFVRQFENITFMTVQGSGHMVPSDQPQASFEMFLKFLKNEMYHEH